MIISKNELKSLIISLLPVAFKYTREFLLVKGKINVKILLAYIIYKGKKIRSLYEFFRTICNFNRSPLCR